MPIRRWARGAKFEDDNKYEASGLFPMVNGCKILYLKVQTPEVTTVLPHTDRAIVPNRKTHNSGTSTN